MNDKKDIFEKLKYNNEKLISDDGLLNLDMFSTVENSIIANQIQKILSDSNTTMDNDLYVFLKKLDTIAKDYKENHISYRKVIIPNTDMKDNELYKTDTGTIGKINSEFKDVNLNLNEKEQHHYEHDNEDLLNTKDMFGNTVNDWTKFNQNEEIKFDKFSDELNYTGELPKDIHLENVLYTLNHLDSDELNRIYYSDVDEFNNIRTNYKVLTDKMKVDWTNAMVNSVIKSMQLGSNVTDSALGKQDPLFEFFLQIVEHGVLGASIGNIRAINTTILDSSAINKIVNTVKRHNRDKFINNIKAKDVTDFTFTNKSDISDWENYFKKEDNLEHVRRINEEFLYKLKNNDLYNIMNNYITNNREYLESLLSLNATLSSPKDIFNYRDDIFNNNIKNTISYKHFEIGTKHNSMRDKLFINIMSNELIIKPSFTLPKGMKFYPIRNVTSEYFGYNMILNKDNTFNLDATKDMYKQYLTDVELEKLLTYLEKHNINMNNEDNIKSKYTDNLMNDDNLLAPITIGFTTVDNKVRKIVDTVDLTGYDILTLDKAKDEIIKNRHIRDKHNLLNIIKQKGGISDEKAILKYLELESTSEIYNVENLMNVLFAANITDEEFKIINSEQLQKTMLQAVKNGKRYLSKELMDIYGNTKLFTNIKDVDKILERYYEKLEVSNSNPTTSKYATNLEKNVKIIETELLNSIREDNSPTNIKKQFKKAAKNLINLRNSFNAIEFTNIYNALDMLADQVILNLDKEAKTEINKNVLLDGIHTKIKNRDFENIPKEKMKPKEKSVDNEDEDIDITQESLEYFDANKIDSSDIKNIKIKIDNTSDDKIKVDMTINSKSNKSLKNNIIFNLTDENKYLLKIKNVIKNYKVLDKLDKVEIIKLLYSNKDVQNLTKKLSITNDKLELNAKPIMQGDHKKIDIEYLLNKHTNNNLKLALLMNSISKSDLIKYIKSKVNNIKNKDDIINVINELNKLVSNIDFDKTSKDLKNIISEKKLSKLDLDKRNRIIDILNEKFAPLLKVINKDDLLNNYKTQILNLKEDSKITKISNTLKSLFTGKRENLENVAIIDKLLNISKVSELDLLKSTEFNKQKHYNDTKILKPNMEQQNYESTIKSEIQDLETKNIETNTMKNAMLKEEFETENQEMQNVLQEYELEKNNMITIKLNTELENKEKNDEALLDYAKSVIKDKEEKQNTDKAQRDKNRESKEAIEDANDNEKNEKESITKILSETDSIDDIFEQTM